MAAASGSLAFLGAARFQGYWDAAANLGTGSNHPDGTVTNAPTGTFVPLFTSGDSVGGGYNKAGLTAGMTLTASIGDYWQVNRAGTTNVDGNNSWRANDWIIYSGSTGTTAGRKWAKLAFEDTIASIVVGDLSASDLFHLTGSADKHVLFISGALDSTVVQTGSSDFVYNYENERVGIGSATPAYKLDVVGNIVGGTSANSHGHVSVRRDGTIVGGMNTQGGVFNLHGSTTVTDTHLTVRSTGKIGIGTVDPAYTLDVIGNVVGGTSANSHGHVSVRRDGSVVGGMNTQGGVFNLHGSSTVTGQHLTIRSGGNVGIGTASPSNKLQIDHTGADGDDGLMIVRADSSTADTNLLGGIGFDSTDGNVPSTITEASVFIAAYAAEDHGTDDKGGDLVFGTSVIDDNDDTTSTEHMRILDSGNVGIGTASPNASAILELSSTTKGLLPPRLTTTQRDAVGSPAEGLLIYNDTTNKLNVHNGSGWEAVGGTTINNPTENELVTVASDTTELDAEANLTFDGSTLKVLGAVAANVISNAAAIAVNTVVTTGYNSLMLGPITINDGKQLTVQDGAVLKIKDISEI